MSEHTPGPWYVDTTKALGPYNILSGSEAVPQINSIVCSFSRDRREDSSDRPRLEADARLIAAAPDLLEIAKECRLALKDYGEYVRNQGCVSWIEDQALIRELDAAITKATGETS